MTDLLEVEAAAGLAVYGARAVPGAVDVLARLLADGVPARLAASGPDLRRPDAQAEGTARRGWLETFRRGRDLLPRLAELRDELLGFGIDHVVLAGTGGSSLAAAAIARTLDVDLAVLDTTDPHAVRAAFADRPATGVFVVSGPSGTAVETDSHLRTLRDAVGDPTRIVVVADPASPLAALADETGAHLLPADPDGGGLPSALAASGLVPAALAGVDVAELIDQAEEFAESLGRRENNPALALGAALGAAARAGRDRVALVDDGTGIVGLGDWAEQLLAGSTGKQGRGILPVVVAMPDSPGVLRDDVLAVTLGGALPPGAVPGGGIAPHLAVNGPLGAQFLCWEYATAVAGRILEVDPLGQPDAARGAEDADRILASGLPPEEPAFVDGPVEVYGADLGHASALGDALGWLLSRVGPSGYLGVLAYLDPTAEGAAAKLRDALADHTSQAVTFGWGPRYLHGCGQYHKGGPPTGAFLQITGAVARDLPIPGRPYTYGQLEAAQAAGDRAALADRGRPVVRLHLTDRAAGVARLLAAVDELPWVS